MVTWQRATRNTPEATKACAIREDTPEVAVLRPSYLVG